MGDLFDAEMNTASGREHAEVLLRVGRNCGESIHSGEDMQAAISGRCSAAIV